MCLASTPLPKELPALSCAAARSRVRKRNARNEHGPGRSCAAIGNRDDRQPRNRPRRLAGRDQGNRSEIHSGIRSGPYRNRAPADGHDCRDPDGQNHHGPLRYFRAESARMNEDRRTPVRFHPSPTIEDYRTHNRAVRDMLKAQEINPDERRSFALRHEIRRFAHWIEISSDGRNDGRRELLLEMATSPTGRCLINQPPTTKGNVSIAVHNSRRSDQAESLVAGGLAAWMNGRDEIRITALGRSEATKINDLIRSFFDSP